MRLDLLAVAAHPDDVELTCGGTLLKMARHGYKTGILDLTAGEMGTRGTAETRAREAAAAQLLDASREEEELLRHHLAELEVTGLVDPAHAALPDLGQDLEAAGEHLAGNEGADGAAAAAGRCRRRTACPRSSRRRGSPGS